MSDIIIIIKSEKLWNVKATIEKMRHLETNTVPIIVLTLGMIKTETHKHINKIPGSPSQ